MSNRTVIKFRAMNTDVEAILIHKAARQQLSEAETQAEAGEYAALVKRWFGDMEARLSRFRANSELSRLNRSAGSWLLVSDILFDILAEAEAFRLRTEGLFNVNVLEALRASGYDQSFEKAAHFSPSMLSVGAALPLQPFMEMDAGMKAVKLRSGAQVDLGGIAKGWSVRKLSDWLRRKRGIKTGLINAGGDAAVWDERTDAAPAELRIQNPWDASSSDATITVRGGGVATSSTLGRSWKTPSGVYHHIIDPRGMRPSSSDVVQCTITGPDVTACEVWAKVVCIAGLEQGKALLVKHAPAYEAYMYRTDHSLYKHEAAISQKETGRRFK